MGTVTEMTDTSISVEAMNGTIQTVVLTDNTKYLRGDASVTPKVIKVGDHIVIHATGKPGHLIAVELKVGAMKHRNGMKMGWVAGYGSSNRRAISPKSADNVKDPVCGMSVDPEKAIASQYTEA